MITIALHYILKSGNLSPPSLFFYLMTTLVIHGLLCIHTNCNIFCCCSSSVKNSNRSKGLRVLTALEAFAPLILLSCVFGISLRISLKGIELFQAVLMGLGYCYN